ncbi:hypothetical protein CHCC14821_1553 [Bacillus paralicheniformis]|nr:hypothetical protein CHCC14821_1553 [Bacillus paralicheniformis]
MFAAFFINCSVPPLLSSFIVIQLGYLKDFFLRVQQRHSEKKRAAQHDQLFHLSAD